MANRAAGDACVEQNSVVRSPSSSLLLLEVLGIHGSRHRLSIDIESKSIDVRTELIDKLGCPPSPSRPDADTQAMPADIWSKILYRLPPRVLCLLGGACKFLREICTADSLWAVHHKLMWKRDAIDKQVAVGEMDKVLQACLKDLTQRRAAEASKHEGGGRGEGGGGAITGTATAYSTSTFHHHFFCRRMNARRRVERTWLQLNKFAGGELARSPIQAGISEYEIFLLEQTLSLPLPLQLRELYLLANGEDETFGFGLHGQTGMIHGLRFLPLEEAILGAEEEKKEQEGATHALSEREREDPPETRIPITALAGFGGVGERYVVVGETGQVKKLSGLSEHAVGEDLLSFLECLLR